VSPRDFWRGVCAERALYYERNTADVLAFCTTDQRALFLEKHRPGAAELRRWASEEEEP